jgi:hypothetical protein
MDERAIEAARAWDDAEAAIARIDQTLEERERRLATAPSATEWQPPAPETPQPVRRSVAPSERSQQRVPVDWEATGRWIDGKIGKQLKDFAEGFGGDIGAELATIEKRQRAELLAEFKTMLDGLRSELRAEIVAAEQRLRIADLEARLHEAEARSVPRPQPRLIGGSDAAD